MTDETGNDPTLSQQDERALVAILDELIPPSADGRFPGAGEAGMASHIAQVMEDSPMIVPAVRQGLAALETKLEERGASELGALAAEVRSELMHELSDAEPGFLPALIFHTYARYYRLPSVMEALGLEARPPFPKGYEMEANDFSLLEAVRKRGKIYRDC